MNRNIKYRSVAYGTWHVGDARKFVEEKFNNQINNIKLNDIESKIYPPKDETIIDKKDKNFLTLQISSDNDILFKDELKSVTPIIEVPINFKFLPNFDYYNQEDTFLTISTTETDSLQFDSLKKRKKISINNQYSMADSGIVDNSDSSPEGDWYSSTEYIQYCQKMQQTANTEDDFSFSSTIPNTKKDDNNDCCSLETIYQNSVLNDSFNNSQDNSIIMKENNKYYTNLSPYDEKNNIKYFSNSIDKRRAKSVEVNILHSVIPNDQGYNTMRIKNLKNPSTITMKDELKCDIFYDNTNNKNEFINSRKDGNQIADNYDNKRDKSFSAIKSTKNFFQRIFNNSSSTLPKKMKKINDKNVSKNEDWSNINDKRTMQRYGTIHRTKTDTNYIINPTIYHDLLKKQYQSDIHINNHIHQYINENLYKDLSNDKSLSQKSSSDSCYTSATSSNSPIYTSNNKSIIDKLKDERLIKEKDYPSIDDFKNWNEIHTYLKNELEVIREKDNRILEQLRYTEEQMNKYKKSLL